MGERTCRGARDSLQRGLSSLVTSEVVMIIEVKKTWRVDCRFFFCGPACFLEGQNIGSWGDCCHMRGLDIQVEGDELLMSLNRPCQSCRPQAKGLQSRAQVIQRGGAIGY